MSDTPWTPPGEDDDAPGPPPPPSSPPPPPSQWAPPAVPSSPPPPPPGAVPPPPPGFGAAPTHSPAGWSGGRLIPLRPLRVGEILDAAVKLLQSTFVQVALLVVITTGVVNLLTALVGPNVPGFGSMFSASPEELAEMEAGFGPGYYIALGAQMLLTIVAQLAVLPLVRGAVTSMSLAADRDGDASWQAGLRTAWDLKGRLIGLSLLLFVGAIPVFIVIGLIVFLPIGLFVGGVGGGGGVALAVLWGVVTGIGALAAIAVVFALLYLAEPAIVIERATVTDAIRRSFGLVRPNVWRVVGIVVLAGLLVVVAQSALGFLQFPLLWFGGRIAQVGTGLITTLAYLVTIPFQVNVALLLYVDGRVRHEGLDVAVLTAELDAR